MLQLGDSAARLLPSLGGHKNSISIARFGATYGRFVGFVVSLGHSVLVVFEKQIMSAILLSKNYKQLTFLFLSEHPAG